MMHKREAFPRFSSGFIVVASVLFAVVSAEIFSSMADVETLVRTERQVLDIVQRFQKDELYKLTAAKQYLAEMRKMINFDNNTETERFVAHPVNAFLFIKQLTIRWKELWEIINKNHRKGALAELEELKLEGQFPKEEDVKGAAEAIYRLQKTYKIHPEDFATGKILGSPKPVFFTSRQAFLVGHRQAQEKYFASAAEWFKISVRKFEELPDSDSGKTVALHTNILDWLQYSIFNHNRNVTKVLEISQLIKRLDPKYSNVDVNLKNYGDLLTQLTAAEKEKLKEPEAPFDFGGGHYEALCRGELGFVPKFPKHFRCYYESYKNPFLRVQPIKTEVVHVDPDVFVLYDIMLDSQINDIKTVGKEYMKRATVIDAHGSKTGQVTNSRVSKSGFLDAALHPTINKVNIFTGHASNLNASQAEQFQLNIYGLGGHYLTHYDQFRDPEKQGLHLIEPHLGDRIATLLIYMSNVEAGGATVFPRLNLTLFPVKGAAVLWYNLYRDGEGDARTLHSGCPVLSGTKWVSNKWFREVEQDVTRPCGLQPDSPQNETEQFATSFSSAL